MVPENDNPFLKTSEAAQFLRRAKPTLEKDRLRGTGPCFVKIGGQVFYRLSDLKAYRDGLPARQSTAEGR